MRAAIFTASTMFLILVLAAPSHGQTPGWLGINVVDGKDEGALVRGVENGSPAAQAGLKENDLIIEYNKTPVLGVAQFTRLVRETPVGRNVEMKIRRDNQVETLNLTTGERPNNFGRPLRVQPPDLSGLKENLRNLRVFAGDMPRISVSTSYTQWGIRADDMTSQLREFFGVDREKGVLVASVESGSAAEKAGVKAGDVIISAGGSTVRSPSDFSRDAQRAGNSLTLRIVRDKNERELTVNRDSDSR